MNSEIFRAYSGTWAIPFPENLHHCWFYGRFLVWCFWWRAWQIKKGLSKMYQWEGKHGDTYCSSVANTMWNTVLFWKRCSSWEKVLLWNELGPRRVHPRSWGCCWELRACGALCFLLPGPGFSFTEQSSLLSPGLSPQTPRAAESWAPTPAQFCWRFI